MVGVLDWLRVFFEEATNGNFNLADWESHVSCRPAILLTDCKSVYDALNQQWTSGSKCDKRASIDLAIIRDTLSRDFSRVRWIDTRMQLADSLTKRGVPMALLRYVLTHCRYVIVEEQEALQIKKARAHKKGNNHESGGISRPTCASYDEEARRLMGSLF